MSIPSDTEWLRWWIQAAPFATKGSPIPPLRLPMTKEKECEMVVWYATVWRELRGRELMVL